MTNCIGRTERAISEEELIEREREKERIRSRAPHQCPSPPQKKNKSKAMVQNRGEKKEVKY